MFDVVMAAPHSHEREIVRPFPLCRSGEGEVQNIRENGCDNLYFLKEGIQFHLYPELYLVSELFMSGFYVASHH
jgi:hypothetical protein